jgi:thiol:disulfide interchange protein
MKEIPRWLYWTPRILSILLAAFLLMFSFDVYTPGMSAGQVALGFLMHNIPVMILAIIIAFAWKWEIVGAIAFALAGLLYMGLTLANVFNGDLPWYIAASWSLTLSGPAFAIAFLYFLNWKRKHRSK